MGGVSLFEAMVELRAVERPADEAIHPQLQALEALEAFILDHRPTSSTEAVAILDIVIPAIAAGGRPDGRDVRALRNIQAMLINRAP